MSGNLLYGISYHLPNFILIIKMSKNYYKVNKATSITEC